MYQGKYHRCSGRRRDWRPLSVTLMQVANQLPSWPHCHAAGLIYPVFSLFSFNFVIILLSPSTPRHLDFPTSLPF
jgi:hypothetical protein